MRAMTADFTYKFTGFLTTDRQVKDYRKRLRSIFEKHLASDVYDAYNQFLESMPEWPPNNIQLMKIIIEIEEKRKQQSKNAQEIQKRVELPPPKHEINALELLREAKKEKQGDDKGDKKSWLERKKLALQNHEAVLFLNWHKFNHGPTGENHKCIYPGCEKNGAISSNAGKYAVYFCAEHWILN